MPKNILIPLLVTLGSGIAIGLQASLNSASGRTVPPAITGLLVNFTGGVVSAVVLAVIYFKDGPQSFSAVNASTILLIIGAGILGILIISGIAYAFPSTGVAAGIAALLVGQMLVAVIVDTLGLSGGQPIPLTWLRIAGFGLLGLGIWAILPRG